VKPETVTNGTVALIRLLGLRKIISNDSEVFNQLEGNANSINNREWEVEFA